MELKEIFALSMRITLYEHRSSRTFTSRVQNVRIWAESQVDVSAAIHSAAAEVLGIPVHALLECAPWPDRNEEPCVVLRLHTVSGHIVLCEELTNDDEFTDFIAENAF